MLIILGDLTSGKLVVRRGLEFMTGYATFGIFYIISLNFGLRSGCIWLSKIPFALLSLEFVPLVPSVMLSRTMEFARHLAPWMHLSPPLQSFTMDWWLFELIDWCVYSTHLVLGTPFLLGVDDSYWLLRCWFQKSFFLTDIDKNKFVSIFQKFHKPDLLCKIEY